MQTILYANICYLSWSISFQPSNQYAGSAWPCAIMRPPRHPSGSPTCSNPHATAAHGQASCKSPAIKNASGAHLAVEIRKQSPNLWEMWGNQQKMRMLLDIDTRIEFIYFYLPQLRHVWSSTIPFWGAVFEPVPFHPGFAPNCLINLRNPHFDVLNIKQCFSLDLPCTKLLDMVGCFIWNI